MFFGQVLTLQKGRVISLVVNAFQGVFKPQATARQNKSSYLAI